MNYLIIASTVDPAGMNISHALVDGWGFNLLDKRFDDCPTYELGNITLVHTRSEVIYADSLGGRFDSDVFIFVSKHSSESGRSCLSSHFPGNFSTNVHYGGRPRELAYTYPSLHKEYLTALWEQRQYTPEYHVTTEPMHHGPTALTKPVLFVEIGSTDAQWKDTKTADHVASSLMNTLQKAPLNDRTGIAFGGVHYSDKLTHAIVNDGYALGAISPKYVLPHVDEHLLSQMIHKSLEPAKYALLDWKGLGREKQKILSLLDQEGLEIIRI